MEVTRELCEAYADEILALAEPDRLSSVWALAERAVREEAPGLIIVVGLTLRDRGHTDWAEYVFNVALKVPGARGAALFELSVAASLTGRPQEAVILLSRLEAEQPLNAYQQRAYVHQLIRTGDHEGALARLEIAHQQEPWQVEEHTTLRQFADYWRQHPLDAALARCRALRNVYPSRTPEQLAADITAALDSGRPYSLIRVNDGEGSVLHLSVSDEAEYHALYTRNRREFHTKFWFGDLSMEFDPAYTRTCRELNAVLKRADCLGADHSLGLPVEYRWASLRNVPCLFNVVRKLEQIAAEPDFEPGRIGLCDPQVAHPLLFEGHLERLIRSRPQLGLISCHAALPEALKRRFDLAEVFFHKTPGEAAVEDRAAREPFGVWHERLCEEVSQARSGVLYLVGAGIPGKIYCDLIKKAGGVALDIGAIADVWMKAPTRSGIEAFAQYALKA